MSDQPAEKKKARFRLNSIFLKLALIIVVMAGAMTAFTSVMYTGSAVRDLRAALERSALEIASLQAQSLNGAVAFADVEVLRGGIEALTGRDASATLHGLVLSAQGAPIVSAGSAPSLEPELVSLGQEAIGSGETTVSPDGLTIAVPVFYLNNETPVGAYVTAWTAEHMIASAKASQRQVVIAASLVMLAGVMALVLFLRYWMTRPMVRTAQVLDRVAENDFDAPVSVARRGDELGDIGKAITGLQARLKANEERVLEGQFCGIAFDSTASALMLADKDFHVTTVNAAVKRIFEDHREDFESIVKGFSPDTVVGMSMDAFHPGALAGRVRAIMSNRENLPYVAHISIGEGRFRLTISPVDDDAGDLAGYVVEWADKTREYLNEAILNAINLNQLNAEFSVAGKLINANDHFLQAIGSTLDEIVSASTESLFDFDDQLAQERGPVLSRLTSGESVYGRFALKCSDARNIVVEGGFTPVLDTRGTLLRIVMIGNDVTETQEAIKRAERQKEKAKAAQDKVVDSLRRGLEALADGNLTMRIEDPFSEDYEQLRSDFNLAAERLLDAMRGVIDNAGLITGEAAEISNAADDLSARTERQAATLEETAAALDELTSSVRSAAEGATHASEIVENARANAEASGDVVREAVEAMGVIEASSSQISKITGVIDDIAFQTNLLALNAGVEAARAGEAGRGFAVVASEVRALAQRSSDAASEINELIAASGGQVKRGVALVAQTGTALKGIVDSVTEISTSVAAIASSSREQSAGLAEINTAVNQLDQVTQQNAAMFEETTAASHALTREAETLVQTMAKFNIGDPPITTRAAPDPVRFSPSATMERATVTMTPGSSSQALQAEPTDDDDGWDDF